MAYALTYEGFTTLDKSYSMLFGTGRITSTMQCADLDDEDDAPGEYKSDTQYSEEVGPIQALL